MRATTGRIAEAVLAWIIDDVALWVDGAAGSRSWLWSRNATWRRAADDAMAACARYRASAMMASPGKPVKLFYAAACLPLAEA